MVQEICRDIKKLDYAKRHLSSTITALKRTHMLGILTSLTTSDHRLHVGEEMHSHKLGFFVRRCCLCCCYQWRRWSSWRRCATRDNTFTLATYSKQWTSFLSSSPTTLTSPKSNSSKFVSFFIFFPSTFLSSKSHLRRLTLTQTVGHRCGRQEKVESEGLRRVPERGWETSGEW